MPHKSEINRRERRETQSFNFLKKGRRVFSDALYKKKVIRQLFRVFFIGKGAIRNDIDSSVLLRTILANIGIYIAQKKLFGKYFPRGNLDAEIDVMVEIILHGIEKR